MAEVPMEVFRHGLSTQIVKHIRPPTRRDLGRKIRKLKPIHTTRAVVEETLSVAKGLPAEDEASGLLRVTPGGVLKPTKSTATGETVKLKLQDPSHIVSFLKMEERAPTRGFGAARLILKKGAEKKGATGKVVAMAAAPLRLRAFFPKGKAALRNLPTITLSFNRVYLDENADVTFGVTTYPPWMRQRLRAEIFKAFIQMGQRRLPVDPEQYERVRARLADPSLCGQYASAQPPLPPPLPSPPPDTPSRKRKAAASPKTEAKAKKTKPAPVVGEVARFVRESGAWGGHSRWFLAEWTHEGYQPWWEAWRSKGEGEPGTPVVCCSIPITHCPAHCRCTGVRHSSDWLWTAVTESGRSGHNPLLCHTPQHSPPLLLADCNLAHTLALFSLLHLFLALACSKLTWMPLREARRYKAWEEWEETRRSV